MAMQLAGLSAELERAGHRPAAGAGARLWPAANALSLGGLPMQTDELRPARGIALGLILVAPFWGVVILVALRLLS